MGSGAIPADSSDAQPWLRRLRVAPGSSGLPVGMPRHISWTGATNSACRSLHVSPRVNTFQPVHLEVTTWRTRLGHCQIPISRQRSWIHGLNIHFDVKIDQTRFWVPWLVGTPFWAWYHKFEWELNYISWNKQKQDIPGFEPVAQHSWSKRIAKTSGKGMVIDSLKLHFREPKEQRTRPNFAVEM